MYKIRVVCKLPNIFIAWKQMSSAWRQVSTKWVYATFHLFKIPQNWKVLWINGVTFYASRMYATEFNLEPGPCGTSTSWPPRISKFVVSVLKLLFCILENRSPNTKTRPGRKTRTFASNSGTGMASTLQDIGLTHKFFVIEIWNGKYIEVWERTSEHNHQ